jgi:menaquinone-specific isochorismate synthase
MTHGATQAFISTKKELAIRLRQFWSAPPDGPSNRLHRIELPLPHMSPIQWLCGQDSPTQYYWADRKNEFEMAAVGEADVLEPRGETDLSDLFRTMRDRLHPAFKGQRYYGGFRFANTAPPAGRWKNFKAYRFVMPRFEVLKRSSGVFLACNLFGARGSEDSSQLDKILLHLETLTCHPQSQPIALPNVLERYDLPDQAGWKKLIKDALGAFSRREMAKVVLARETTFTADGPFNAAHLLERLIDNTINSYVFCFHPTKDRALIGASPERLFKRSNCLLQSEAVAGTRPRGTSDHSDRELARTLHNSKKDLYEHKLVVDMLYKHFKTFCRHMEMEEEPSIMQLRHCQHLRTRIEGILNEADIDAALVHTLHPTPAVGGTPRSKALQWLEENEPFDRGIFAAPVGWVGNDATEFAVAIRSGLVQDNQLTLYNGAGIVEGSNPAEEWDEIENKMCNFSHLLRYKETYEQESSE